MYNVFLEINWCKIQGNYALHFCTYVMINNSSTLHKQQTPSPKAIISAAPTLLGCDINSSQGGERIFQDVTEQKCCLKTGTYVNCQLH